MNMKTIYALAFGSVVGFALVHFFSKRAGAAPAASRNTPADPYAFLDQPVDDWLDTIKNG